jgi:site-specific DNA recombinase
MKLGIEVISLKEQYGQDPVGVLIRQIIGAVNEFERKQIVERLKDVMNNKAKSGYTQNRPPLGYKIVNKETVVDEEKKQVIVDIFKMRAEGKSLREISKITGISHVGIKKILKNKFYLGYVMFNKTYYKGKHSPIIDEELFNAANSKA